jgi:sugar (pentulose or hexulose) kinase
VARTEGAPLGAAMLAGWGVGVLPNLPEAAGQWIALGETTRPRKHVADFYARRLERYESLLRLLDPASR